MNLPIEVERVLKMLAEYGVHEMKFELYNSPTSMVDTGDTADIMIRFRVKVPKPELEREVEDVLR